MNQLDTKLYEVAMRIHEMRTVLGLSAAHMAKECGTTLEDYLRYESGKSDLPFSFVHKCALVFGLELTELLEGDTARLRSYTVTRRGAGRITAREAGIEIRSLAPMFRDKIAEPYYVRYTYQQDLQDKPIHQTTHGGQEFDYVLQGKLRVRIGEHEEVLGEGDSIYYNSATPHGMIAVGGQDCLFCAVVLPGEAHPPAQPTLPHSTQSVPEEAVWQEFITVEEESSGAPKQVAFHGEAQFNFAYDVIDTLAQRKGEQLALLHVDRMGQEKRFTFADLARHSARAANYFRALGIRPGDCVMLVLRRNWQFWVAMLGLHRLGAVALPATDQLMEKDYTYRFAAANVTAVLASCDSDAPYQMELSLTQSPRALVKIAVNGSRAGWHSFDEEYTLYRSTCPRTADTPCGDAPMLMYFTSGTTGYPKLAVHSFRYALGHFVTARYWHCVQPGRLHFTISDTGWGKAVWGKLYGQWLCEAAVFVYDFDRFRAEDILPMFAKYDIATFCAPPTMYRFLIREDLSSYDLSSIAHASTAGEALNPEVYERFRAATGLSVMEGFGQTETTLVLGNFRGMQPRVGSMGKPNPQYQVFLADAHGQEVPVGETGEIAIRTAQGRPCGLFLGYGDARGVAQGDAGALYRTGDLAWMDEDGYYWYVGRADDVIKSSGYRIGPFEIESVIMELPYVLECGVSAAPDEVRGQVVKASVVLVAGTQPSEELAQQIKDYVKHRTAPYKYPRIVVFCERLPKTISGKIQRNLL